MGKLKKVALKLSAETDPASDEEESMDRLLSDEIRTRRLTRMRHFPALRSIFGTFLTVRRTFPVIDLLTI